MTRTQNIIAGIIGVTIGTVVFVILAVFVYKALDLEGREKPHTAREWSR
jgi:hypothetical protein